MATYAAYDAVVKRLNIFLASNVNHTGLLTFLKKINHQTKTAVENKQDLHHDFDNLT